MAICGAAAPGEIVRSGSRVILEALRLKLRGASTPIKSTSQIRRSACLPENPECRRAFLCGKMSYSAMMPRSTWLS